MKATIALVIFFGIFAFVGFLESRKKNKKGNAQNLTQQESHYDPEDRWLGI